VHNRSGSIGCGSPRFPPFASANSANHDDFRRIIYPRLRYRRFLPPALSPFRPPRLLLGPASSLPG
jgi:hypothetical protein